MLSSNALLRVHCGANVSLAIKVKNTPLRASRTLGSIREDELRTGAEKAQRQLGATLAMAPTQFQVRAGFDSGRRGRDAGQSLKPHAVPEASASTIFSRSPPATLATRTNLPSSLPLTTNVMFIARMFAFKLFQQQASILGRV